MKILFLTIFWKIFYENLISKHFLDVFLDLGQVRGLGIIRPMSNMSTWHSPKLKPRTSRQSNSSSSKPVPVPRSRSRKNSVTPSKAPIPSDRKSNSGNYKSGKFLRQVCLVSKIAGG